VRQRAAHDKERGDVGLGSLATQVAKHILLACCGPLDYLHSVSAAAMHRNPFLRFEVTGTRAVTPPATHSTVTVPRGMHRSGSG
jgi:hypothetical protein